MPAGCARSAKSPLRNDHALNPRPPGRPRRAGASFLERRRKNGKVCSAFVLALVACFALLSSSARAKAVVDPASCEACIVYHDLIFDLLAGGGPIEVEDAKRLEVCKDPFWRLSTNMHSSDFTSACAQIHDSGAYDGWPTGTEMWPDDHASHQLLVTVKSAVCVRKLEACSEADVAPRLDRQRTDCEKCRAVTRKIAGFLARYDVEHISEYRRDGLIDKRVGQDDFCSFDRDAFDDPKLGTTADVDSYCDEFVRAKFNQMVAAFGNHGTSLESLAGDLCRPPCDLDYHDEL